MSRTSILTRTAVATLIAAAFPLAAIAQQAGDTGSGSMYDRNVHQQQRIEQGLRDGSLTVQEAANLERSQARISQMEARALADGRLSDAERARINEAQNRQSGAIERERSDNQRGDPNSRSSQRMQEDVQRNVNEQRRIAQGVQSGQITNQEAARLERSESRIFRQEARAGADGRIDRYEQRQIQGAENRQSQAIHHERHDGQTRGQTHGRDRADGPQGHGGNRFGQSYQGAHGAAGGTGSGTAFTPGTHTNNGHHYGRMNQTSGAATAPTTTNTQATPRTRTNNGNHFGQANRSTTVAQSGNERGNERGNGRGNRR